MLVSLTRSIVFIVIAALPPLTAAADGKKTAIRIPGTYSNLQYSAESGDLSGLEIKIVPVGGRFQAAVLVSEGEPQRFVIVEVRVSGKNSVRFDVPAKDGTGWTFSGSISAKALTGTVRYAMGVTEKVVLKRRCGYWDH